MLLQTNSYFVPKEKRAEHARLMRRFRQALAKLGCDMFEVYEQVGANWTGAENGRYVQIMRFRDGKHQVADQNADCTGRRGGHHTSYVPPVAPSTDDRVLPDGRRLCDR